MNNLNTENPAETVARYVRVSADPFQSLCCVYTPWRYYSPSMTETSHGTEDMESVTRNSASAATNSANPVTSDLSSARASNVRKSYRKAVTSGDRCFGWCFSFPPPQTCCHSRVDLKHRRRKKQGPFSKRRERYTCNKTHSTKITGHLLCFGRRSNTRCNTISSSVMYNRCVSLLWSRANTFRTLVDSRWFFAASVRALEAQFWRCHV